MTPRGTTQQADLSTLLAAAADSLDISPEIYEDAVLTYEDVGNWLAEEACRSRRGPPRPELLASEEPFARFVAMTSVLGQSEDGAEVRRTRKAVVADPGVRALVDRLPDWESGFAYSGHNSPGFPPKLLRLLHGLGVRAGDFAAMEHRPGRSTRGRGPPAGPGGRPGGVRQRSSAR